MPESVIQTADRTSLNLPSVLDVTAAAELKRRLVELLGTDSQISIDASAVQRVTTPWLQVLVAAANGAVRSGSGRLRMHSVPAVLSDTIAMLGLSDVLGTGEA